MKTWMTVVLLGPLLACGATTPAPNHAVVSKVAAPDVSFANYHTFSFGLAEPPQPGYEVTPRSLEVQSRLQVLVKAALEDRGLTETTGNADVVVKLATGSGSGYQLRTSSQGSVLLPAERAPGPPPAVGFIGIDLYARATGNQIWKGAAFAEIDPMKIDDALLRRGVDHMLAGFGPQPTASVAQTPRGRRSP
jgi:hypothetical protein